VIFLDLLQDFCYHIVLMVVSSSLDSLEQLAVGKKQHWFPPDKN